MFKVERKDPSQVRTFLIEADRVDEAVRVANMRWSYLRTFEEKEFTRIGLVYEHTDSLLLDH